MTTPLIASIALALAIGAVWFWWRRYFRAVVTGAIVAMVATAIAAITYIAIDYRELSLWPVLLAPVFESAVLGSIAALGFKLVSVRLGGLPLIALATACGCALGLLLGALFVGYSPHLSHDKAVTVLAASWLVVSLVTASTYVLSPNKSLERTREG
jgi:hypothetical protein